MKENNYRGGIKGHTPIETTLEKKNVFFDSYKNHASLVGKVARCSKGEIGLITGRSILPFKTFWIGIPLNRPGEWSARAPVIVANSLQEYLTDAVPAHTYIFTRTQTVKIRMSGDGDEYEGEAVEWANPQAQLEAAFEWAEQTFMDEDYCEDFMEVETTDWERTVPKRQFPNAPMMSSVWLRGGNPPDESITK